MRAGSSRQVIIYKHSQTLTWQHQHQRLPRVVLSAQTFVPTLTAAAIGKPLWGMEGDSHSGDPRTC